jgi:integration host factor subunit alpha
MTLIKSEIVKKIADRTGFSKNKSSETVEQLIEIIKRSLEAGDEILIAGFGKFYVKNKNQRRGRNPANGDVLTIPSRKVVRFKYSRILKNRINGNGRL